MLLLRVSGRGSQTRLFKTCVGAGWQCNLLAKDQPAGSCIPGRLDWRGRATRRRALAEWRELLHELHDPGAVGIRSVVDGVWDLGDEGDELDIDLGLSTLAAFALDEDEGEAEDRGLRLVIDLVHDGHDADAGRVLAAGF